MRKRWQAAGREAEPIAATVLTGGAVLDQGEPADSPRAIARLGRASRCCCTRVADAALSGWPSLAPLPDALAETVAG
jgi:hypothetical protein